MLFAKRTVKTLFFSFVVYCAVTLIFHYFSFIHPHPNSEVAKRFQDLTIALWANLIFAGVFGLLAAVVSLIRPEDESLDKRIGYLYPRSSTLSGDARTMLGKNAMRLAAPAVAGDLHFVVERFDDTKQAFYLTGYVSFVLRNILQDETYEDEVEILVVPDEVPGVEELGRLLESALACNAERKVHAFSRPISAVQKRYQEFVRVSIPAKSEANHTYSFTSWSLERVPFVFFAQRYTENLSVRVSNRCGSQITCVLSKGTSNPTQPPEAIATRQLPSGADVVLKDGLVLNGSRDNIQLVLHM